MLYSFKSTLKFNVGIWTCSNAASRVLTFPLIKTDCWFYRVWNILPVVFVNVAVLNWTELPLKLYHACVCFGARFLVRWEKRWLLFQLSYRLNLILSLQMLGSPGWHNYAYLWPCDTRVFNTKATCSAASMSSYCSRDVTQRYATQFLPPPRILERYSFQWKCTPHATQICSAPGALFELRLLPDDRL